MPHPPKDGAVLGTVKASPPRRLFAYLVLLMLGGTVLWMLLRHPPALGWAVGMALIGIGALGLAEALRRATRVTLTLTAAGLSDSTGRQLVAMSDIVKVNRGSLALKPSNGFVLVLRQPGRVGWAPGLWWRLGRRFGVGGVVSAGAARHMAEVIAGRVGT